MSGEPVRRTPTGRSLRLVHGADASPGAVADGDARQVAPDPDALVLDLPPQRRSVAVGRHWVVRVAASVGVTGMANQVVELLSSELLANAVLHGTRQEGDTPLRIELTRDDDVVRVAVTDAVSARPVVLHPEPVAPAGRGMAIVEAMSQRWGVVEHPAGGKTVWFELDLDEY